MKPLTVVAMTVASAISLMNGVPAQSSEMDEQIARAARNLYVFKTYLKADDITIESRYSVVTLTGTVSEEPRRVLAGETVASLRGVRRVSNKLEVKGERSPENSDAGIGARVKTVLFFHRRVRGLKTEVSVRDGVVTLRGEAIDQAQRDLATECATDVDGVKDVKNEMTVSETEKTEVEAVKERIDDASITAQVKISMLFHRSTRILKPHVETENGVVTLTGTTRSLAENDLITKLVEDVNGVARVDNRMTVAGPMGR